MGSFFFKIYIATTAILVAMFMLFSYFFYEIMVDIDTVLISESDSIYKTVSNRFSQIKEKDWDDEIAHINDVQFNYQLSLIKVNDIHAPNSQLRPLNVKNRVIEYDDEFYFVYLLDNSKQILKIEPVFEEDEFAEVLWWLEEYYPLIVVFVIFAIALLLLVKKLTYPIKHIASIAQKFGDGQFELRANTNFMKPFDSLAMNFNHMAENLDNMLSEQRIMLGAIPHELRSPLARIRFALDLSKTDSSSTKLRARIEQIDAYVDDMHQLIDNTLEFFKLQNKATINKKPLNVIRILDEILNVLEIDINKIKVEINAEKNLILNANPSLFKLVLKNVIENAIRYTDTQIDIKISKINQYVIIKVSDDGKGMNKAEMEKIFSPFSTLDQSRNKSLSGTGLGLAMVKLIMSKHSGDVQVSESSAKGAQFTLYWPLNLTQS